MSKIAVHGLVLVIMLAPTAFGNEFSRRPRVVWCQATDADCQGDGEPRELPVPALEPIREPDRDSGHSEPLPEAATEPSAIEEFADQVFRSESSESEEVDDSPKGEEDASERSVPSVSATPISQLDWSAVFEQPPRQTDSQPTTTGNSSRDAVYGSSQPLLFTWAPRVLAHRTLYFEDMPLERYGQSSGKCLQPIKSGFRFFADALTAPLQFLHERPCDLHYVLPLARPGICACNLRQPVVPYVPK